VHKHTHTTSVWKLSKICTLQNVRIPVPQVSTQVTNVLGCTWCGSTLKRVAAAVSTATTTTTVLTGTHLVASSLFVTENYLQVVRQHWHLGFCVTVARDSHILKHSSIPKERSFVYQSANTHTVTHLHARMHARTHNSAFGSNQTHDQAPTSAPLFT